MSKLSVYNFITLNGFYKGAGEDISWHEHGAEENEYAAEMLSTGFGNILLFGRVTYDLMAGYWPTEMALKNDPEVAEGMNKAEKVVFSRSLKKADWNNTSVVNGNMIEWIKKMKAQSGRNMTLLGSGTILTQLALHGLIDEYQFMLDPVAISNGTPIFNRIGKKLELTLTGCSTFKSGSILLVYEHK